MKLLHDAIPSVKDILKVLAGFAVLFGVHCVPGILGY